LLGHRKAVVGIDAMRCEATLAASRTRKRSIENAPAVRQHEPWELTWRRRLVEKLLATDGSIERKLASTNFFQAWMWRNVGVIFEKGQAYPAFVVSSEGNLVAKWFSHEWAKGKRARLLLTEMQGLSRIRLSSGRSAGERTKVLILFHRNTISRAIPVGAPRRGHKRAPGPAKPQPVYHRSIIEDPYR
jgi:hypothetical protein